MPPDSRAMSHTPGAASAARLQPLPAHAPTRTSRALGSRLWMRASRMSARVWRGRAWLGGAGGGGELGLTEFVEGSA